MAAIHIQTITDMKPLVQQTKQDSAQLKRYEQTAICSVADLVKSNNSPNVIELVHRGERPSVVAMVQLALCEYLDTVSLRSTMNDMQIEKAANLMVDKHPHLPVQAFAIFFQDAMCNEFGPHYGRMDIPTLMGWLQQFEQNYFEQVEEQAYQEHVSTKGDNANFVDILQKHKALAAPEDEAVPMPDDFFKNLREKKRRKEIEERVHKENMHLYSHMSVEEADSIIDALIKNELSNN